VLTVALAEEDGGDPAAPATQASPATRDGRWLLSGVKTAVPALPSADVVLVPACHGDDVMVFLVEPSDAGVILEPQALMDGAPAGRLVLDGAELPADRVLGGPGQGADVAGWLAARATVGLCAVQAGTLGRALELTAEYARTREQFGRPIGSFQAVAQRLADAYIDVEATWLTMWQAAYLLSELPSLPAGPTDGGEVAAAVASAKFWAADAGHRVAHTAVHVHGGTGIDLSHPIHKYFTAAKHAEFTLGGATQQLVTLGDLLA
jgi:acyl-CoA dehydrogenase